MHTLKRGGPCAWTLLHKKTGSLYLPLSAANLERLLQTVQAQARNLDYHMASTHELYRS